MPQRTLSLLHYGDRYHYAPWYTDQEIKNR